MIQLLPKSIGKKTSLEIQKKQACLVDQFQKNNRSTSRNVLSLFVMINMLDILSKLIQLIPLYVKKKNWQVIEWIM